MGTFGVDLLPSFHLIGCKTDQSLRGHPIPRLRTRVTLFSHPTSLAEKYRPLLWLPARVLPYGYWPGTAHPRPSHKDRCPRPDVRAPMSCAGESSNNFGQTTADGDAGWLAGQGRGPPNLQCLASFLSFKSISGSSIALLGGPFLSFLHCLHPLSNPYLATTLVFVILIAFFSASVWHSSLGQFNIGRK